MAAPHPGFAPTPPPVMPAAAAGQQPAGAVAVALTPQHEVPAPLLRRVRFAAAITLGLAIASIMLGHIGPVAIASVIIFALGLRATSKPNRTHMRLFACWNSCLAILALVVAAVALVFAVPFISCACDTECVDAAYDVIQEGRAWALNHTAELGINMTAPRPPMPHWWPSGGGSGANATAPAAPSPSPSPLSPRRSMKAVVRGQLVTPPAEPAHGPHGNHDGTAAATALTSDHPHARCPFAGTRVGGRMRAISSAIAGWLRGALGGHRHGHGHGHGHGLGGGRHHHSWRHHGPPSHEPTDGAEPGNTGIVPPHPPPPPPAAPTTSNHAARLLEELGFQPHHPSPHDQAPIPVEGDGGIGGPVQQPGGGEEGKGGEAWEAPRGFIAVVRSGFPAREHAPLRLRAVAHAMMQSLLRPFVHGHRHHGGIHGAWHHMPPPPPFVVEPMEESEVQQQEDDSDGMREPGDDQLAEPMTPPLPGFIPEHNMMPPPPVDPVPMPIPLDSTTTAAATTESDAASRPHSHAMLRRMFGMRHLLSVDEAPATNAAHRGHHDGNAAQTSDAAEAVSSWRQSQRDHSRHHKYDGMGDRDVADGKYDASGRPSVRGHGDEDDDSSWKGAAEGMDDDAQAMLIYWLDWSGSLTRTQLQVAAMSACDVAPITIAFGVGLTIVIFAMHGFAASAARRLANHPWYLEQDARRREACEAARAARRAARESGVTAWPPAVAAGAAAMATPPPPSGGTGEQLYRFVPGSGFVAVGAQGGSVSAAPTAPVPSTNGVFAAVTDAIRAGRDSVSAMWQARRGYARAGTADDVEAAQHQATPSASVEMAPVATGGYTVSTAAGARVGGAPPPLATVVDPRIPAAYATPVGHYHVATAPPPPTATLVQGHGPYLSGAAPSFGGTTVAPTAPPVPGAGAAFTYAMPPSGRQW